jgi:hypothetical protein
MKIQQSFFGAALVMALAAGLGCGGSTTTTDTGGTATDEGKAISSVEITPDKTTLSKGVSTRFHAMVHYADGTTKDISEDRDAVWNTSKPTVATVTKGGMVTTLKEGVVEITVEYKGEKGSEHFIVLP